MFKNWARSKERQKRIEKLEEKIWEILETDFSHSSVEDVARIRRQEQLINSGLSALRLQQGEHRLANNLTIAIVSFVSGIAGGILSYFFH